MIKSLEKTKRERKHNFERMIVHFADPERIDHLHKESFKESLIFSIQWLLANYTEWELWDDDLRAALHRIQSSHVFELKFFAHKMLCGCGDKETLRWIERGGH